MPILELFPSKGALLLFVSTSVGAHTTCPDGLRGESVKTTVRQHFFGTRQHFFGTRNPITKHMDELFCPSSPHETQNLAPAHVPFWKETWTNSP